MKKTCKGCKAYSRAYGCGLLKKTTEEMGTDVIGEPCMVGKPLEDCVKPKTWVAYAFEAEKLIRDLVIQKYGKKKRKQVKKYV